MVRLAKLDRRRESQHKSDDHAVRGGRPVEEAQLRDHGLDDRGHDRKLVYLRPHVRSSPRRRRQPEGAFRSSTRGADVES